MQTLLLSIIGALTLGGGIGWAINNNSQESNRIENQAEKTIQNQVVNDVVIEASDFVSARPGIDSLPMQALSEDETTGLVFMREEEKLARDVYMTLYEKWGLSIFTNIAQSEQTHTEAVRNLLVKYNISDPVVDDSIGVFVNETLQKLYNDLTAQGLASIEKALTVGAIIEDLDISDLEVQIDLTDNDDIKLVYENLLRGSRNHLRSFISQLESRGGSYEPQYISETKFKEIINSARETGSKGGASNTSGGGRGWGNKR